MTDWQPIETAPLDGVTVILFVPGVNSWSRPDGLPDFVLGAWEVFLNKGKWVSDICEIEGGWESTGEYMVPIDLHPTHWMPLPPPPSEEPTP